MSKRSFTSIFVLMLLLPAFSSVSCGAASTKKTAQVKPPSQGQGKTKKAAKKGPIVITSDTLSADQTTHTAIFEGRVAAKNDNMELYADKMVVHYAEDGGVQTIDATGSVKLIKEGRVVTAGQAHYEKASDSILFSKNPKIAQAKTVVTGTTIKYFVSTDKMDVTNSKVFIEGK